MRPPASWPRPAPPPHSFRAVYGCAAVYLAYGAGSHDTEQLKRALELLEQSKVLLAQNDDPRVSEATICGDLSIAWFLLGEKEKSIELLRKNNAGGMFSSDIGLILSIFGRIRKKQHRFCRRRLNRGCPACLPRSSVMCSCFGPETTGIRQWTSFPGG